MTEKKWTPGPWTVTRARYPTDGEYDYGIGVRRDGREYCIAETFGVAGPEFLPPAEANARLIAAAPEMAEAIDLLLKSTWGTDASHAALARVEAALAKARGA